ncbi:MAG TPA: dihydropteroate synthase [Kiritimatiellia bacterium]|nr:dihydropteroate synthase [Kiritimatiellia bacterium]
MTSPLWKARDHEWILDRRTIIMGVLNVTPDSFSDGGRHVDPESALKSALEMVAAGADIIDVGGESSRPGSDPVPQEEELRRVVPVVRAIADASPVAVSVDTTKAEVAEAALTVGASIINDISGGAHDPRIFDVARKFRAGLVLMHMKGNPKTMQDDPRYENVVEEVVRTLRAQIDRALAAGVSPEQIVVDPGIGFGKNLEHNVTLLQSLPDIIHTCGRPVLVGLSRKRFIGAITGRDIQDRLPGSLAAMAFAMMRGARIIRVHDVNESCDVARMMDTLTSGKGDR